jgi:hypothetical protein
MRGLGEISLANSAWENHKTMTIISSSEEMLLPEITLRLIWTLDLLLCHYINY